MESIKLTIFVDKKTHRRLVSAVYNNFVMICILDSIDGNDLNIDAHKFGDNPKVELIIENWLENHAIDIIATKITKQIKLLINE